MTDLPRLKLKRSSLLLNVSPMANVPAVWTLNVFKRRVAPGKTNMSRENQWLEDGY